MVTTVTMARPESNLGRPTHIPSPRKQPFPGLPTLAGGMLLACLPLWTSAAQWDGAARLSVSETYTDNLRLSVNDEEHESITQINPGFSLTGRGGRASVAADYTMQNLFYAHNPDRNGTKHQLSAAGQSELVKDWFYFDANASISQQLVSPGDRLAQDNLNLAGNRSDVVTLQVEPYIRRQLGGYATTELRYSHGWVDYDTDGVSDTESSVASAYIANGYDASHLFWRIGYREQRDIRDTAPDSVRQSTDGFVRYRALSTLSLVAYAGRVENDIQTNRSNADGSYWSAGFIWQPSPKFSLEGTKGENDERGRLTWTPSTRTSFAIGYRHREVGLNTGETWDGNITHRTRRSTWSLSYTEEVTSVQVLQLREFQSLIVLDLQGGVAFDPGTGEFVDLTNPFELTDEEFLRARAQGSVNYRTGKSTLSLSLYNETRTYELSAQELDSQGGTAAWQWRFASRTSSRLSVQAQRFEVLNSSDSADSVTTRLSLNRQISPRTSGRVELSHLEADVAGSGEEYDENRIAVHVNMTF